MCDSFNRTGSSLVALLHYSRTYERGAGSIDTAEPQKSHAAERRNARAPIAQRGKASRNALAAALNDAGQRTGTGQPLDGIAAGNLRNHHHIPTARGLAAAGSAGRQGGGT